MSHFSLCLHHSLWHWASDTRETRESNFLIVPVITSDLSPASRRHSEQRLSVGPPRPPQTKLSVSGLAWMGMLNDIIWKDPPQDFNDGRARKRTLKLPPALPRTLAGIAVDREMRRREALMSHCLRSLSGLQNVRLQDPKSHSQRSGWLDLPRTGLSHGLTAAGIGNDGVKGPLPSVA